MAEGTNNTASNSQIVLAAEQVGQLIETMIAWNKTMGQVTQAVTDMSEVVRGHGAKIDKLVLDVHRLKTKDEMMERYRTPESGSMPVAPRARLAERIITAAFSKPQLALAALVGVLAGMGARYVFPILLRYLGVAP